MNEDWTYFEYDGNQYRAKRVGQDRDAIQIETMGWVHAFSTTSIPWSLGRHSGPVFEKGLEVTRGLDDDY